MDASAWTGWILAMVIAVTQLLVALAALWRVVSVELRVEQVASSLNGRLDMLLAERELRLRAEHAAEVAQERALSLAGMVPAARPEGIIREVPGPGPGPGPGDGGAMWKRPEG